MTVPLLQPVRRLRGPARRDSLLDSAAVLVLEQGFSVLSVEAVARRAGVTRAVVYRHFPDLPGLLRTLLDRETARAQAQVGATTPDDLTGGDPAEQLLEHLARFLQCVQDDPGTWRFVLLPPEGAPAALRERIEQGRESVRRRLARAVATALGPGLDTELTARLLAAACDEYARLLLTDPTRWPPERLVEHARWWLDR